MPRPSESTSKTRRGRTARGEATLARLLQAAEEVFAEQGFHGGSIAEITRRAGVGLGTFYFYFAGKAEIFRAVVRQLEQEWRRETAAASHGAPDRVTAEQRAFAAYFAFAARHPRHTRILSEAEYVDPALARAYYEEFGRAYARVLARAQERGEVRAIDPDTLAHILMGAGEGVYRRWIVWEGKPPPRAVLEAIGEFLAAVLRPPEAVATAVEVRASPRKQTKEAE